MEYIRLYQELIHGNRIHILNLGVLYLYAGIANYELHNIKESIRNLSRAKVFGEKIFVKKEAENMLQRIQENSCNSEYDKINRMIEESSEQARKEYEEYLLQVLKE
jgi:hypothetical protein